jgi:predicted nucleic acid-binding protein
VADGQLGLIVTPIVVAELVYVARSLLGWTRKVTANKLGSLLEADGLVLTEGPVLARALRLFGERSRLDFADAYLAACALELGPQAVASFDADLDTVEGIRRISA